MKTAHFLKTDTIPFQQLFEAPLDYTTRYRRKFKLEKVLVKSSVPITETITITLKSKHGTNYDTILRQYTMNNNSHFVYTPKDHNNFQEGDEINIHCTNENITGVIYAQIKASEM